MAQGTTKGVPIDIDPLLAADSNLLVPSQKAIKTYTDAGLLSKQGTITLTTTGTSGAATLIGNTLNIPQYSGGGGSAAGSTGNIQYNNGGAFAGSNNLFWDNTNIRLGIGTASPAYPFHLYNGATQRTFITNTGQQAWFISDGTSEIGEIAYSTPAGFPGIVTGTFSAGNYLTNRFDLINRGTSFRLGFDASNSGLGNLGIFNTGNVVISTSGMTDAGYKLDVNGTARVSSSLIGIGVVYSGLQFLSGSGTGVKVYRTTSAGGQVTPTAFFGNPSNLVAGTASIAIDGTNYISLAASNGSLPITRAAIQITNLTNTAGAETGDLIFLTKASGAAMNEKMRITSAGGLTLTATNTPAGTTGNQTINRPSGTVNIAAAGTTITVTNSLVTTSSIVFATIRTNDATAVIKNVVPAAGSFTINLNAAATAETSIGFFVIN